MSEPKIATKSEVMALLCTIEDQATTIARLEAENKRLRDRVCLIAAECEASLTSDTPADFYLANVAAMAAGVLAEPPANPTTVTGTTT